MLRTGGQIKRGLAKASNAEPNLGRFGLIGTDITLGVLMEPPLMIKEIRTANRKCISGLLVQLGDDNVIIDVTENTQHIEFANRLRDLKLEIVDGTLQVEIDGVRKRCRQAGVFEDLETSPGRLVLPRRFHIPKVETLASKDDSFGKSKWRAELNALAEEIFPDGIEGLPPECRKVLMFPGLGQEADLWKEFGFSEEEMSFIEEDPYVVKVLKQKYPNAKIFAKNAESNLTDFKRFIGPDSFSVISIDPESKYTSSFMSFLIALRSHIANEALFAHNFYVRRESPAVVQNYRAISKIEDKNVPIEELRSAANRRLLQWIFDQIRHPYNFKAPNFIKTVEGQYESGSKGSMIYAMHHLRKANASK